MPEMPKNPLTDTLGLVEVHHIPRVKILPQTILPENGFSLELYRNGLHQGSTRSGQGMHASGGDTIYRINLGPGTLPVTGLLTTDGGYTREYSMIVMLQVIESTSFIEIYRQSRDPVHLVQMGIQEAIQTYAYRTRYEQMHATNLEAKAKYAFDGDANKLRAGIRIIGVYQSILKANKDYKPVINYSPTLTLEGQIRTLDGYIRNYKFTLELEVTDQEQYHQLNQEGAEPLKLAQIAIEGQLQHYARQQREEDLTETSMREVIERTFSTLSNRVASCMKIVRTHSLSLEGTLINSSPLLVIKGQITTRDKYIRPYEVSVELKITNPRRYQQLQYEGSDPLEMARVAITGELQKYALQQFYDDLSEAGLRSIVEHAFDEHPSRVVECIKVIYTHRLVLEEDSRYQPLNLSPLLTITNQLITKEEYKHSYEVSVALQIVEPRRYQQLTYEGSDPLEHAKMSIHSELQKHAREQSYEDLNEAKLSEVIESALEKSQNNITSVLKVVRAYDFSLSADPNYIHLGSRTLTITGQIRTSDYRERLYEIIVELEVANAPEFVRLTRQGNNPLDLISIAIKGAIQRATEHKTHDELSGETIAEATCEAFSKVPNHTIGGLKLVKPYQAVLQVDPRIQEEHDINHNAHIEEARKRNQAKQSKVDINAAFEAKALELEKTQELLSLEQSLEERKNSFSSAQEMAAKLNAIYMNSIEEDLKERLANGQSILELIRETKSAQQLLSSPGQASWRSIDREDQQNLNDQEVESYAVEIKQVVEQDTSQSNHAHPSASTSKTIKISEWGVLLRECPLPLDLYDIAGGQRAFQVMDITDEARNQNSPFQDLDILMKINGQKAYTREAIETILLSLQSEQPVQVQVLREGFGMPLTLRPLSDRQNQG